MEIRARGQKPVPETKYTEEIGNGNPPVEATRYEEWEEFSESADGDDVGHTGFVGSFDCLRDSPNDSWTCHFEGIHGGDTNMMAFGSGEGIEDAELNSMEVAGVEQVEFSPSGSDANVSVSDTKMRFYFNDSGQCKIRGNKLDCNEI